MCNNEKKTNYGKIIAITAAAVAGACAIIWFALKLYRKYCLLDKYDYDDEFSDLPDADFDAMADGECEVVLEEDEAKEDVIPGIDTDVAPIDLSDDAAAETV
ncbi:MAG: hypothetical protein IJW40_05400 [Clostridia bacterium]|nr:hypothetical protein [Clostridia bacterium]